MRILSYPFILLFVVVLTVAPAFASPAAEYEQAKKSYYEQDYETAKKLFSRLLEETPDNAYLNYNLGNVFYKMGQAGRAVQYYEKARLLNPRLKNLRFNLDLAQNSRVDQFKKSTADFLTGTFYFWFGWLNVTEYRLLLAIFSCLFWGFCFWRFFSGKTLLTLRFWLAAFGFVYVCCGYVLKADLEQPGSFGVIVSPDVDVKASYLDQDKPLFQLHGASKVKIIDEQSFGSNGKWYRIELPGGENGWVKAGDVGVI